MSPKSAGAVPDVSTVECPRGPIIEQSTMTKARHRLLPFVDRVALGVEIYVWRCDWCHEEWAVLDAALRAERKRDG